MKMIDYLIMFHKDVKEFMKLDPFKENASEYLKETVFTDLVSILKRAAEVSENLFPDLFIAMSGTMKKKLETIRLDKEKETRMIETCIKKEHGEEATRIMHNLLVLIYKI
jgi:hypothetical protein